MPSVWTLVSIFFWSDWHTALPIPPVPLLLPNALGHSLRLWVKVAGWFALLYWGGRREGDQFPSADPLIYYLLDLGHKLRSLSASAPHLHNPTIDEETDDPEPRALHPQCDSISLPSCSQDDTASRRYPPATMPSPQRSFRNSTPAGEPAHKQSQFTFRNLSQMASYNPSCPLRVVTHIDLDCFYAQAEMVRLGVPEDRPLAVQQWCGLPIVHRSRIRELIRDIAKAGPHRCQLPSTCLWDWPYVHCDGSEEALSQHHQPTRRDLAGRG